VSPSRPRLSAAQYADGILAGHRVTLARAITLIESELPADADLAAEVLDRILPHTGHSRRIGISGVPGSGKSTFIDTLGMHLIRDRGERIAVLSVDPSSPFSGGSILGDKTRMERLAVDDHAFIRPSPARGHLGGVARRTRPAMLLCEAAGFRNVIVETVGVGQSETAVRSMTDFFLLLTLAGAGDELQGIKRGILEMVDCVAVNKADGDNKPGAFRARTELAAALHLFPAAATGWVPPVVVCSALAGDGVSEIWDIVLAHHAQLESGGHLASQRREQSLAWMRELIAIGLEDSFQQHPAVKQRFPELENRVRDGHTSSFAAARELLLLFLGGQQP
jgi:LAO/AO transport system kinase